MNESRSGSARYAFVGYGLLAYASFHAAFLYLIVFLGDGPVPFTLESGPARPLGVALAIDAALISLFAIQHTLMARSGFKRWWTRFVPEPVERSTFVIATGVCLALMMTLWSPIGGSIWHVGDPTTRGLLFAVQGIGWLILVASTFLMDHWALFGVRQVFAHFHGKLIPGMPFRTPSLYRFVRHPMMVGVMIGLWAAPDMTGSRFAIAIGLTLYIMVGVRFEEHGLIEALGDDYRAYQRSVPRLIPRLFPRPTTSPGVDGRVKADGL